MPLGTFPPGRLPFPDPLPLPRRRVASDFQQLSPSLLDTLPTGRQSPHDLPPRRPRRTPPHPLAIASPRGALSTTHVTLSPPAATVTVGGRRPTLTLHGGAKTLSVPAATITVQGR